MKELNVFKFVELLFLSRKKYSEITNKQKNDFFFLANRILSIKYPLQAAKLNVNGIDPITAIDSWFYYIGSQNPKGYPNWIYTKFSAAHKKDKSKVYNYDKSIIQYYQKKYQIGKTDFEYLLQFCEQDVLDELKFLDKNKESLSL